MELALPGIAIGTSGCKTAAFSPDGRVPAQSSASCAADYPHPGRAEQNPDVWRDAACAAVCGIGKAVPPGAVCGVGVDGRSRSAIPAGEHGQALCSTPNRMDARAKVLCGELSRRPEQV